MIRGFLCALSLVIIFLLITGCDDEYYDDGDCGYPPPYVVSVVPSGGSITSNTLITITFNKVVYEVTVKISAIETAAYTSDGKVFVFEPGQVGKLELSIEARDEMGAQLDPPFPGTTYTATLPDTEELEQNDNKG